MIKKFKDWLGIEGVKASVELDHPITTEQEFLSGKLHLVTIRPQYIQLIQLRFIEKYKRGKKDSLKIDEFELGSLGLELDSSLNPQEVKSIPFRIPFQILESNMDKWGKKNLINKSIASLLKKEQQVSSVYQLEIKIMGTGSALPPQFKFPVLFNKKSKSE